MGVFSTINDILTAAYGVGYAERAVEKVKEAKDMLVGASKNAVATYSSSQTNTSQNSANQDGRKIKKALDAFDE